jgi:uncharacterized protein
VEGTNGLVTLIPASLRDQLSRSHSMPGRPFGRDLLKLPAEKIRVVSVGVGVYPSPKPSWFSKTRWAQKLKHVQLLQKTLEINTQSMDQLRHVLFRHIPTVRISDTFEQPEMATDLFEHNMTKLNILRQRGAESFASRENALKEYLL